MRVSSILMLVLLLASSGSAKRKGSKRGRRAASTAALAPRIDRIKMQLQDGALPLDEGVAQLVALDEQAKQPADVATLNAVLGELYRHRTAAARSCPPEDRALRGRSLPPRIRRVGAR